MRALSVLVPDALDEIARREGRTPEEVASRALQQWAAEELADAAEIGVVRKRWDEIESGIVETDDWERVKAELGAPPDQSPPRR